LHSAVLHNFTACLSFQHTPSPGQRASQSIASKYPANDAERLTSVCVTTALLYPHVHTLCINACWRERIDSLATINDSLCSSESKWVVLPPGDAQASSIRIGFSSNDSCMMTCSINMLLASCT